MLHSSESLRVNNLWGLSGCHLLVSPSFTPGSQGILEYVLMHFHLYIHRGHLESRRLDPNVQRVLLGSYGSMRYIFTFEISEANVLVGRVSPMLKGCVDGLVGVMIVSSFKYSRPLPRLETQRGHERGKASCSFVWID